MTRDTNGKNVTRMQLQTRIWIKDALMQLLKEYSFDDITVKQIVLTAKISRPTFYRNYSSKKEVLDDAITDIMLDYKEKV
jgi:Transcriptional regulator